MARHIVYHFASGDAFFSGALLILAAAALGFWRPVPWRVRARNWAAWAGIMLVALSAVPLAWWLYALWCFAVIGWLVAARRDTSRRRRVAARFLHVATVALTLTAISLEAWSRRSQPCSGERYSTLYVIGDSISDGMLGPDETVWPSLFQDEYGIDVVNLAQAGGTARSAVRQAALIGDGPGLVLIEIGGNDVLGPTTADQFARDLEQLLSAVQRPGRRVVMLELPLPPLYNRFGRAQRTLAARYGVEIVHRSRFANVLARADATLDGLHLSEAGHAAMARMVWKEVGGCLRGTE